MTILCSPKPLSNSSSIHSYTCLASFHREELSFFLPTLLLSFLLISIWSHGFFSLNINVLKYISVTKNICLPSLVKGEPQFHNVMLAHDLHSVELYNYQPLKNNAFVICHPVPERPDLCSFANTSLTSTDQPAVLLGSQRVFMLGTCSLIENWWCFWVTYLANIYTLNEILIKSSSLSLTHQKNVFSTLFLWVSIAFHSTQKTSFISVSEAVLNTCLKEL